MADFDDERPADEKGAQQVHPDKPAPAEPGARREPNETPRGRPQHEPRDPDREQW